MKLKRLLTLIIIGLVLAMIVTVLVAVFTYYNTKHSSYVDPKAIVYVIFIPVLIGLIFLYDKFIKKKGGGKGKGGIRRGWTEQEKEDVRHRQGGVCAKCGKSPPRWEYHHRNGNRSDNSLSNCQALCPNCHSVKTHD